MRVDREDLMAYEDIKKSGMVSLSELKLLSLFTELPPAKIRYIQKHYEELCLKYPGVKRDFHK